MCNVIVKISQKSNANFVIGYALNLCKFHIYNVPYNHNITEEGMDDVIDCTRLYRVDGVIANRPTMERSYLKRLFTCDNYRRSAPVESVDAG